MKFERVDDKTVKCFISNEELDEYEIDYKDFVMRSDKAKHVVHEIIEEATRQVGFKPPKFAFDMQIMMMPEQGLLLTFSESEPNLPEAKQLLQYLSEMKKALQGQLGAADGDPGANPAKATGLPSPAKPEKAIFSFDALAQIMDYAALLPSNLRVKSSLYAMDGVYYLYLQKGSASYERYSKACIQALEFGKLYGADEKLMTQIKEHGKCLIENKALLKLKA